MLLAQTPGAIAGIDLRVLPEAPGETKGRRRAPASASSAEGKKGSAGREGRRRREEAGTSRWRNWRIRACSWGSRAGAHGHGGAAWKDVLKNIPEPMYRHRFGT